MATKVTRSPAPVTIPGMAVKKLRFNRGSIRFASLNVPSALSDPQN